MNETSKDLLAELELAKSLMKLSPEERRTEVVGQTYTELKAMEMERRQRVALETTDKCKRDREERDKATDSRRRQRGEKEEMWQEGLEKMKQNQLKKERLQWNEVMMVKEREGPGDSLSALEKEHERRREEAELCRLPTVREEADPESLASSLESPERKETLHNNWVGEELMDSDPVKENGHTNSSIRLLFAARDHTSEEKSKTPKHNETRQWRQDRLRIASKTGRVSQ